MRALQRDLNAAGYWLGTPDGTYGHLTEQAVMALQKSAGLTRDGVAGRKTLDALAEGTLPPLPSGPADRVEIDLERQVLLVVRGAASRTSSTPAPPPARPTSPAGSRRSP